MYVDYDQYASMSPLQKNKVIGEITAENKAELTTTHWHRFLETNRSRLNPEQIDFIEESIAFVHEEEDTKRSKEMEARLHELFVFSDVVALHMEVFKNSGVIRNPIAQALVREKPQVGESGVQNLRAALQDLATVPLEKLRSHRYGDDDVATLLGRAYTGIPSPEKFWSLLSDEDVRLAAWRAYALIKS